MTTNRARVTLAIAAVALLLAAGWQSMLSGAETAVEESLEPSSTSDVAAALAAIDSGAQSRLAELLPTTEAYQRAVAVRDALRAGVPSNVPSMTLDQLDLIAATARGAVSGATSTTAAPSLSSAELAIAQGVAQGLMAGLIGQMPPAVNSGVYDTSETLAAATLEAATLAADAGASLSQAQAASWATTTFTHAFDEMDEHAATLAAISGSAAMSDVRAYASAFVRTQLARFPAGALDAQVLEMAAFAGGALVGAAVGAAESFPRDVPQPQSEALTRWYEGLATGHEGIPPWDPSTGGSVDPLVDWGYALATGAPRTVADAYYRLDITPTESAYLLVAAWAEGLARGGIEHLGAAPASAIPAGEAVQAYADGLLATALPYLLSRTDGASVDTDGLETYGASLTKGLEDLHAGLALPPSLDAYLANLATAATSLPPELGGMQIVLLQSFGENATARLATRLADVHATTLREDDPDLLLAMVTGLRDGAVAIILNESADATPPEMGALVTGMTSAFLETKDPQALFDDSTAIGEAARVWIGSLIPEAAVAPIASDGTQRAGRVYDAFSTFAFTHGTAPVYWSIGKGSGATGQGFGTAADILWVAALAEATARQVLPLSLDELPPDAGGVQAARYQSALMNYSASLAQNASSVAITDALDEVHPLALVGHVANFSDVLLAPAKWIHYPSVDGEVAAANATLGLLVQNTTALERLVTDPQYAAGVTAFLTFIGSGIDAAHPTLANASNNLSAQAPLLQPWVEGTVGAVLPAPTKNVTTHLEQRGAWVVAVTTAAALAVNDTVNAQANDTREFADAVTRWVLEGGEHPTVPNASDVPLPIVTWLNATLVPLLETLPPSPSQAEMDAIVAYAMGIVTAIEEAPTPPGTTWTDAQIAALTAWLTQLSAGAPAIQNDIEVLLAQAQCEEANIGCPKPADPCKENPDAPECQPCQTDCPPDCENDPEAEGCPPPPEPSCWDDPACAESELRNITKAYADNLQIWTHALVGSVLRGVDETNATRDGALLVGVWASAVLADQGVVIDPEDEQPVTFEGPRGRPYDFANATAERIQQFGESMAAGYAALLDVGAAASTDPALVAANITGPMAAWTSAMQDATAGYFTDEDNQPKPPASPGVGGAFPTSPPSDPTDPAALNAWFDAMWLAVADELRGLGDYDPFASDSITPLATHVDYVVFEAIARGGLDGVIDSQQAAFNEARPLVPATGPIDAFAVALVNASRDQLVAATLDDANVTAAYLSGVAQGGVAALLAARENVTDRQVPGIIAYATLLANATWIKAPPTPDTCFVTPKLCPADEEEPEEEEPETGGSGEEEGESYEGPYALDNFTAALQTHGAALAAQITSAPLNATIENATNASGYPLVLLTYVQVLQESGRLTPPIAPDEGYLARLHTWTSAQTAGALGTPPNLTVDRLTPTPDVELAKQFIAAFAGVSPWGLGDAATDNITNASAWATAVVTTITQTICPEESALACAELGQLLGDAYGDGLPSGLFGDEDDDGTGSGDNTTAPPTPPATIGDGGGDAPPAPTPPSDDQIAFAKALVNGTIAGLASAEIPYRAERDAAREAVAGTTAALIQELPPPPDARAIAEATVAAALAQAEELPAPVVGDLARAIAATLAEQRGPIDAHMAQAQAAADAAVASLGPTPTEDEILALVQAFLVKDVALEGTQAPQPTVAVSSAGTRLRAPTLDGTRWLSGLSTNTFHVTPPASLAAGQWAIEWRAGATGAPQRLSLVEQQGSYTANIPAATLRALNAGTTIHFVILQTVGVQETRHDNAGSPYAYKLDIELPRVTFEAPAIPSGATVPLAWSGVDASSGIGTYRVQVREGPTADWTDLLASTSATRFDFTGNPGVTYSFRAKARDHAAHESVWSTIVHASIPEAAPANSAPTISFRAPAAGAIYTKTFVAEVAAADPDGTTPMVKVCVRRAAEAIDLVCMPETTASQIEIDVSKLPDGRLRLHATATDGTLTAEAVSRAFTLDRAPPVLRGIDVTYNDRQAVVTVGTDGTAAAATISVLDATGREIATKPLNDDAATPDARRNDGVWTTSIRLDPGNYRFVVTARDAQGNAAMISLTRELKAPATTNATNPTGTPTTGPAGTGTGQNGTNTGGTPKTPTTPLATPPSATPTGAISGAAPINEDRGFLGIPMPPIAWLLLALGAAAIALRRRDGRRE